MNRKLTIHCLTKSTYELYMSDEYGERIEKMKKNQDSGFDLLLPKKMNIEGNVFSQLIKFDIIVTLHEEDGTSLPFYLTPRSSTGKNTFIRQSNSIGIIDRKYRDELMVYFDHHDKGHTVFEKGVRLFQICPFDGDLRNVEVVICNGGAEVEDVHRGGGFGSTGK